MASREPGRPTMDALQANIIDPTLIPQSTDIIELIRGTKKGRATLSTTLAALGVPSFIEITIGPDQLDAYPFVGGIANIITAVDQGAKKFTGTFPTKGLQAGDSIVIRFSTGNDGTYTVASQTGLTVTVVEAIPDDTVDGGIWGTELLSIKPDFNSGEALIAVATRTITSAGVAWDTDAASDVFLNGQIPPDGSSIFAMTDFLGSGNVPQASWDNSLTVNPIELTPFINKGWQIGTSADLTGGGSTTGTRSVTYRIYYELMSV